MVIILSPLLNINSKQEQFNKHEQFIKQFSKHELLIYLEGKVCQLVDGLNDNIE